VYATGDKPHNINMNAGGGNYADCNDGNAKSIRSNSPRPKPGNSSPDFSNSTGPAGPDSRLENHHKQPVWV